MSDFTAQFRPSCRNFLHLLSVDPPCALNFVHLLVALPSISLLGLISSHELYLIVIGYALCKNSTAMNLSTIIPRNVGPNVDEPIANIRLMMIDTAALRAKRFV